MTSSPRLTLGMLAVLVGPVTGCAAPEEGPPIPSSQLAPPTAGYEEVADSARELSRTFFAREGLPGLSVAVGIDGEVVWAEGFGWADLGQESLLTPLSLLRVGSVSKPLTAAAVGLLYERGLLDLDAPVQDYVPDFPLKRWPVTTRLLMGHIAGVRHYRGDEGRSTQSCDAVPERLAVFADDTLLFEPGHDYSYSSYGWTLIAAVVETIAEEPFLDFMDREVFAPLGLDDTRPDHVDETMPERAKPYVRRSFGTLRQSQYVNFSCKWGGAGILSTPTDMVDFGFAMLDGELLSSETIDMFWTEGRTTSGDRTGYGLGWGSGRQRFDEGAPESPMWGHGGGSVGGRASLMIFPDQRIVVAVATNVTGGDVADLARDLAELFERLRLP